MKVASIYSSNSQMKATKTQNYFFDVRLILFY